MEENPHFEHQILRLSSEKSRHVLHWDSKVNPEDMLQKAAAWHKAYDHKRICYPSAMRGESLSCPMGHPLVIRYFLCQFVTKKISYSLHSQRFSVS